MNIKQRDLLSKYLSDVSKGFLLAGVVGFFADKIALDTLFIHLGVAVDTLVLAYVLEQKS